ncbi:MAG TPA: DUF87 domain-containing protein [Gemmataceae bacterium]|jgi:hypothetical protein|nr:DUF87 domain-containing protein [Gemmataceae bacterium]
MNDGLIPFVVSPGKIIADTPLSLRLNEEHLARHLFVAGGTGGGKSVFTRILCRHLAAQGRGFTVIDPHGTTVRGIAQDLAVRGTDPSLVHWLHPTARSCFSLDIFAAAPKGVTQFEYECWLTATIDRAFSAFERNVALTDQEMMKRLKRWFRNIGYVCGFDVDGRHAGMDKALAMIDPDNPVFEEVLGRVGPRIFSDLGREIMRDFGNLRATKNARQREQWVESLINLLVTVLKPLMRAVFGQNAPSISQREVILNRHMQLVNMKAPNFSREQGNVLGGTLINFLIHTAETIADERAEEDRVPHYLIIEEAENYIGQDLSDGLGELRKCKLSIVLVFQNLGCLRRGNIDLVSKVVSQCGLQITFQQGDPEDIEFFGKSYGYGTLDFTPFKDKRIVPAGYDYVLLPSISKGSTQSVTDASTETHTKARSRAAGMTESQTINSAVSAALSFSHTEAKALGRSFTKSNAEGIGFNRSEGGSESQTNTNTNATGQTHSDTTNAARGLTGSAGEAVKNFDYANRTRTANAGWSDTHGKGSSDGTMQTATQGQSKGKTVQHNEGRTVTLTDTEGRGVSRVTTKSDAVGLMFGASKGIGTGKARMQSEAEAESKATAKSHSIGTTDSVNTGLSVAPLAKHEVEIYDTANLKRSVPDQLAEFMKIVASLPDRVVFVKCKGMDRPFLLRVHDLTDPYDDAVAAGKMEFVPLTRAWRDRELDLYIARVVAAHPYNFVPSQVPFDVPAALPNSVPLLTERERDEEMIA